MYNNNDQTKQYPTVQHHRLHKQVQALKTFLSLPFSSMAVKHGPRLLTQKRVQAFKTKCQRKLLCICYLERKTKDLVRSKINSHAGPQERLLATVERRTLAWFVHITNHNSLSKTIILQGTLEGGRLRGRQRKCWMDIKS